MATQENSTWKFRCPRCREEGASRKYDDSEWICDGCGFQVLLRDGIWRALPEDRAQYYAAFIQDYEAIRLAEHRGHPESEYYLKLPYVDASDSNAGQWNIRARTFSMLAKRILPRLDGGRTQRVLDLGAGNCLLSYRLAQMGMKLTAVDLLVNDLDGLGAGRHYDAVLTRPFCRVQADCNTLPFADAQFDVVIFNASFHYAESYKSVLGEALRCLRAGGSLLIADSPWYARQESGLKMLSERRAFFTRRFGRPSDSLDSQEFLTDERLRELAEKFSLDWKRFTPNYGIRWRLRPWIARLRRKREPSTFRIYLAKKAA